MFKQILLIALTITSITSSCAMTADEMCRTCAILVCALCEEGYPDLTSGGTCKSPSTAVANCKAYSNATTCSVCAPGYYLKDNVCTEIATENCHVAVATTGICTACKNGKVLADGKCTDTACTAENCAVCSVTGTSQTCIECNSGFSLTVSGSASSCKAVDTHCMVSSILGCGMCEEGYYMKGSSCYEKGSVQKLGFMMFFAFLLL